MKTLTVINTVLLGFLILSLVIIPFIKKFHFEIKRNHKTNEYYGIRLVMWRKKIGDWRFAKEILNYNWK